MQTIESIKNRVRQILDDTTGDRFSDDLLENAIRQSLAHLDEQLPLVRELDQQITSAGQDQTLTGLVHPLYLIKIEILKTNQSCAVGSGYSYSLQGVTGELHFNKSGFPRIGAILRVTYAAQNTLAGLDSATDTTLPEAASASMETGAASFACLLRAASLAEAYGTRTGESARLVEQSKVWKEFSEASLTKLKTCQEFEFPSGFALDAWDR